MEYTPGDFILIHGTGFFDRVIQFGQSLRFKGEVTKYNHAALITSPDGKLIEALGHGVKETHISKYPTHTLVGITATPEDRAEAVAFATSCLSDGYGWTTIVSTALCLLLGLKFSFGFEGQDICSGLVARSLERTNSIFPRDPSHMTPADLASFYEA